MFLFHGVFGTRGSKSLVVYICRDKVSSSDFWPDKFLNRCSGLLIACFQ